MCDVLKLMIDTRETRTRNSHEIEHALFDARNSREKYLAASRYNARRSFSYEFLVCHGLKSLSMTVHSLAQVQFHMNILLSKLTKLFTQIMHSCNVAYFKIVFF